MKTGDEYVIDTRICKVEYFYQGEHECTMVVLKEVETGTLFRRAEHRLTQPYKDVRLAEGGKY